MAVNTKRTKTLHEEKLKTIQHKNFMDGESYDISDKVLRLRIMASSCFFGEPMYYKGQNPKVTRSRYSDQYNLDDSERDYLRGTLNSMDIYSPRNHSPAENLEWAIDEALDADPVGTMEIARTLRNEDNIRTTPQIIMVRAAQHPSVKGTGIITEYAPYIIKRADEPAVQMAYQLSKYGKTIPNSLKRAWAKFYENSTDYQLAKYRMENRIVKTVDVINMCHASGKKNPAINSLMKGDLKLTSGRNTWESIISDGGKWEDAINVMGHMALLRNIRNLVKNNVSHALWLSKLIDGVATGKQLPFRYLSAYKIIESEYPSQGVILDGIEDAIMRSVDNIPRISGKSLILADNSGSTQGTPISSMSTMTVAEIGNLMGVLTGYVSDEGVLGVFGDRLETFGIRKRGSIFDQTRKASIIGQDIGGGTENGIWIALNKAITEKQNWDNIFVYSDMQAGHGGLYGLNPSEYSEYIWNGDYGCKHIDIAKLVREYRNKVNPDVNVYLVQIAGYEDTILPEFYDRTYILGGWSDQIFKFANFMNSMRGQNQ